MLSRIPLFSLILLACSTAGFAQERQWNFDQTDKDAYLVFGVPETDDVGISLWCTKQSGTVSFFAPATDPRLKPGRHARITLNINGKRFRYSGKTSSNKDAATTSVEVPLKPSDKLFAAMAEGDHLAVSAGASSQTYPLVDLDLDAFLQLCREP